MSGDTAGLDELIQQITVDAKGNDEQLWAFRQAFEDNIDVPCDATVVGQPVRLTKFDYDGNERRGLIALCRGADGAKHAVAACDVAIPLSARGGRYVAAYRKWMGLAPLAEDPVELVVLSVNQKAARCRRLGDERRITFRAAALRGVVPGEIAVVRPGKQWTYAGDPCLSGVVESTRLDAGALGLVPLRLEKLGLWNPAEH